MKNLVIKIVEILLASFSGLIILIGVFGIAGAFSISSGFAQIIFIISGAISIYFIFLFKYKRFSE